MEDNNKDPGMPLPIRAKKDIMLSGTPLRSVIYTKDLDFNNIQKIQKEIIAETIKIFMDYEGCKKMMKEFGLGIEHCEQVITNLVNLGILQFRIECKDPNIMITCRLFNVFKGDYEYI